MKIQYCSDLHLEFTENRKWIQLNPLIPTAEILVLAGDIVPLRNLKDYDWFFDWISDYFKMTYWIPGNHEYYHYSLTEKDISFTEKIRDNIILLNNKAIELPDCVIHFSTLWAKISKQNEMRVERGVNDFHLIKYNDKSLKATEFNHLHEVSRKFLEQSIGSFPEATNIIVTHHVPTRINYPKEFLDSPLNEAFATELEELIKKLAPKFWIYGHHHRNVPLFQVHGTALLTNQLGYVRYNENEGFHNGRVLEL